METRVLSQAAGSLLYLHVTPVSKASKTATLASHVGPRLLRLLWSLGLPGLPWASFACEQPKGPLGQSFRRVPGWPPTAAPLEGPPEVSQASSWQGSPEFSHPWSGQRAVSQRWLCQGKSSLWAPIVRLTPFLDMTCPRDGSCRGSHTMLKGPRISFPQGMLLNKR